MKCTIPAESYTKTLFKTQAHPQHPKKIVTLHKPPSFDLASGSNGAQYKIKISDNLSILSVVYEVIQTDNVLS